MIQSFSGAHPFRPNCLADAMAEVNGTDRDDILNDLEHLVGLIDAGTCPRCGGPLLPVGASPGIRPAGSRVTSCRCVPVCATCGDLEAVFGSGLVWWPFAPADAEQERAELSRMMEDAEPVIVVDGDTIVTDSGVGEIRPRPHPGGWAEYGYDDGADIEEQRG